MSKWFSAILVAIVVIVCLIAPQGAMQASECKNGFNITVTNNSSVRTGTNVVVTTDKNQLILYDVEASPGKITKGFVKGTKIENIEVIGKNSINIEEDVVSECEDSGENNEEKTDKPEKKKASWGVTTFDCFGYILNRMQWSDGQAFNNHPNGQQYKISVRNNQNGDLQWYCDPMIIDPIVPQAGLGDLSEDGFSEIGSVSLMGRTLALYKGKVENGQVSIARYGVTEYNNQFWVHRIQDFGWVRFQEGDIVTIKGTQYRLVALDRTQGYDLTVDQLPSGILVSCYATGEEWSGLEPFKLVKTNNGRGQHVAAI